MPSANVTCHDCGTTRQDIYVTREEADNGIALILCHGCKKMTTHDVKEIVKKT